MGMHRITKPIFVVGSGRSGTTLLYNILASHNELAWFSNWTNRFPKYPSLAILSRLFSAFEFPYLTDQRFWPAPAMEGIGIHRYCGIYDQLWNEKRSLTEQDIPISSSNQFIDMIEKHQKYHGKKRFIHKNVNNSMRILYLKSIFPDARFIHVVRDGRAVALSLANVSFWQGFDLWWTDYSPSTWEAAGNDPLLLCGLHWQREVKEVLVATEHLANEQYFCLRYEDFVEDPLYWLKDLVAFCDLGWEPRLSATVERKRIRNLNNRWQASVPEDSKMLLQNSIEDTLNIFGYL